MNIARINLDIGIEKPFKILHASDIHLSYANENDEPQKRVHAEKRLEIFEEGAAGQTMTCYRELLKKSKEYDAFVITGDLIDFISDENLRIVKESLKNTDYLFAAGNHEFCIYVGLGKEDAEFKAGNYPLIKDYYKGNMFFDSKIVNGVNLVTADNSYYNFNEEQVQKFQNEIQKGYPILLFVHNPIFAPTLESKCVKVWGCAVMCCSPEEILNKYPNSKQRLATDESTKKFVRLIEQEPLVKAVFAGHLHFHSEDALACGKMQFLAGGAYCGEANEIYVK